MSGIEIKDSGQTVIAGGKTFTLNPKTRVFESNSGKQADDVAFGLTPADIELFSRAIRKAQNLDKPGFQLKLDKDSNTFTYVAKEGTRPKKNGGERYATLDHLKPGNLVMIGGEIRKITKVEYEKGDEPKSTGSSRDKEYENASHKLTVTYEGAHVALSAVSDGKTEIVDSSAAAAAAQGSAPIVDTQENISATLKAMFSDQPSEIIALEPIFSGFNINDTASALLSKTIIDAIIANPDLEIKKEDILGLKGAIIALAMPNLTTEYRHIKDVTENLTSGDMTFAFDGGLIPEAFHAQTTSVTLIAKDDGAKAFTPSEIGEPLFVHGYSKQEHGQFVIQYNPQDEAFKVGDLIDLKGNVRNVIQVEQKEYEGTPFYHVHYDGAHINGNAPAAI